MREVEDDVSGLSYPPRSLHRQPAFFSCCYAEIRAKVQVTGGNGARATVISTEFYGGFIAGG